MINRRQFLRIAAITASGSATLPHRLYAGPSNLPVRGGTVTCGMSFLIVVPDPHRYAGWWARQSMSLCWEGLTTPVPVGERLKLMEEMGPDAAIPEVRPMLAENWEIDRDGKRYVFHLKKGVKFHNGKELDSEDVKWNWLRIQDPVHIASSRKFLTHFLDSIDTPDRHTIVANLSRPYGSFLTANAWCYTGIVPRDAVPYGAIWGFTPTFRPPTVAPPGTGPFVMTEFQQNLQAVFEKFDDYRIDGLPYLDKVIYKVIGPDGPRTVALRAGNLDYTWSVDHSWLEKNLDKKELYQHHRLEKEKLNLYPFINPSTRTIYLNCHENADTPFKDERVRQALDYCLDKETLSRTLYGNLGIPMSQGYNPKISAWGVPDIKSRKRDINKARELLRAAGYANGLDVDFKVTSEWGRNEIRAQVIQQMAKPAGFRMNIIIQFGPQYSADLRTYTYHMMMGSIRGEDPMNFYFRTLHTDPAEPYNGYSRSLGIKDEEMDQLLDQVAEEIDFEKRKLIFKDIVQRSADKAYWLPNNQVVISSVWSDKLKNFNPSKYYHPQQAFIEAWMDG